MKIALLLRLMRRPEASILRLSKMSFRQARAHSDYDLPEAKYPNGSSGGTRKRSTGEESEKLLLRAPLSRTES